MGFSLSKWVKRATKIPKSIKKIKLGNVLKTTAVGFVTGGPAGAFIGAAGGAAAEKQRVDQERAEAASAQAAIDESTRGIPMYAAQAPAETPPSQIPLIPGIEVKSTRTFIVLGLIAGGILLLVLMRKR